MSNSLPAPADRFGERAELFVTPHIERQDNVGCELFGDRTHEALGLLVGERDGKLGALRAEGLRAAERNGILVGDADDQRLLAGQRKHESASRKIEGTAARSGTHDVSAR